jgi:D-3-phosphoglycerate dehydrogenase
MKKILCITPLIHLPKPFDFLRSFGPVDYNPNITKSQMLETKLSQYDVIFCCPNGQPFVLNEETLKNFRGTILSASTGLNHIDLEYCKENNVRVLCHKEDHEGLLNHLPSTSELAFGLMLSLLRNIPQSQEHVKDFNWKYKQFIGRQVKDLKVGIVGYGRLGKMMHRFCEAFEAKVLIYDPYVENTNCKDLKEMFSQCDVISLHVHASPDTKHMIDKNLLSLMKPNSYIVNTARGEIVNEEHIVAALKNNRLSGYGADVVEHEFTDIKKSPIINAMNEGHNIIVTPHVGGSTWEGSERAYMWSISKLKDL